MICPFHLILLSDLIDCAGVSVNFDYWRKQKTVVAPYGSDYRCRLLSMLLEFLDFLDFKRFGFVGDRLRFGFRLGHFKNASGGQCGNLLSGQLRDNGSGKVGGAALGDSGFVGFRRLENFGLPYRRPTNDLDGIGQTIERLGSLIEPAAVAVVGDDAENRLMR